MTPDQITAFEPAAAPYAQAIIDTCARFGITAMPDQAMFLAQISHESGGFQWMRELWGPTQAQSGYAQREDLGNTLPEAIAFAQARGMDVGRFYAGHGAIAVTGYYNTNAYSQFMYGDSRCAADPTMLSRSPDCILSAGWFWSTRGCYKLVGLGEESDFVAVTKRINGGTIGLSDRLTRWAAAKKALGVMP